MCNLYNKSLILGGRVSIQYCHWQYCDTMLNRFFTPTLNWRLGSFQFFRMYKATVGTLNFTKKSWIGPFVVTTYIILMLQERPADGQVRFVPGTFFIFETTFSNITWRLNWTFKQQAFIVSIFAGFWTSTTDHNYFTTK